MVTSLINANHEDLLVITGIRRSGIESVIEEHLKNMKKGHFKTIVTTRKFVYQGPHPVLNDDMMLMTCPF